MRPANTTLSNKRKEETILLVRNPKKFRQDFDLLCAGSSFQEDINILRKKWGINFNEEYQHLVESSHADITSFLKKHELSPGWDYIIRCYIINNKFEPMGDPYAISISHENETNNIKTNSQNTLSDFINAHEYITKRKEGKIHKSKLSKNHHRDTDIYSFREKNFTYKQIQSLIKDNYGESLEQADISRILDKMKKRRSEIR